VIRTGWIVSVPEVLMLTKCANPACNATFRYLRDGRVFKIERPAGHTPHVAGKKPPQLVEHFWLCDGCAVQMTLGVDFYGNVITVPLEEPMGRRAAAS
jgi:hypothetical protein